MYKMNAPLFVVSVAAFGFLLSGCFNGGDSTERSSAANSSFFLVNVLDKEVFDDCRIKGSINVPYEEVKTYAVQHWDKNKSRVVVYCANPQCTASLEAAKILVNELGFNKNNVWAYEAGTAGALKEGLSVEGPCKESYLKEYKAAPERHEEEGIQIISTENLKKMLEEFATRQ